MINFLFNWFWNDEQDIAYLQSGWFPLRAPGTDPSLPTWGTGRFDWRGFNAGELHLAEGRRSAGCRRTSTRSAATSSAGTTSRRPGWRAADDIWSYGSVHRSERLEDRVRAAIAGAAKIDLPRLVSIMGDAGTVDLRGQEVWPLLRQVIGNPADAAAPAPRGAARRVGRTRRPPGGSRRRQLLRGLARPWL